MIDGDGGGRGRVVWWCGGLWQWGGGLGWWLDRRRGLEVGFMDWQSSNTRGWVLPPSSLPAASFVVKFIRSYLLASTKTPRSATERYRRPYKIVESSGAFSAELHGSTLSLDANAPTFPPKNPFPSYPYIHTPRPASAPHPSHGPLTNSTDPHSPPPSSSPSSPSPTDRTSPPHCPSARLHTISPRPAPL